MERRLTSLLNCEEAKVFLPWLPLFCCGGPKGI